MSQITMDVPNEGLQTWDDPIVAEVRRTRNEHAAKFHYDLEAIYRDLKEREKSSGRTYVRLPPRACLPLSRVNDRGGTQAE